MRYLIEYSSTESVSGVVDRAMQFDIVHGVVAQLDPTWLGLWRLRHSLTRSDCEAMDRRLVRTLEIAFGYGPWPPGPEFWPTGFPLNYPGVREVTPVNVDLTWSCATWDFLVRADPMNRSQPFVLNVLVVPRSTSSSILELTAALSESSERIRFETRPVARMTAKRTGAVRPLKGGSSLGTDVRGYGTLGGILDDGTGTRYALTCGHVASDGEEVKQPSPKDRGRAKRIGSCVLSTAAALQGPVAKCQRAVATNEIDAALIRLDDPGATTLEVLGIGSLAGSSRIDDVSSEASVEISARSGHRPLYTGGLFVTGSLFMGTNRYCFRNLLEIKRTSATNWGVTGTLSSPVRPGDSGSWVIQDGPNGPEWCAMVVGGGGPVGYAVFAESILGWLENQNYKGMRVT
jgi:hypothetical protein